MLPDRAARLRYTVMTLAIVQDVSELESAVVASIQQRSMKARGRGLPVAASWRGESFPIISLSALWIIK
jgi:hypothetical protein